MAGLKRNDNLPACETENGDTCKKALEDGADITKEYTSGLQEGQAKKTKICLNVNPVSLVKILPWGEKIARHSLVQQGNDWVLENDNSIGPKFWEATETKIIVRPPNPEEIERCDYEIGYYDPISEEEVREYANEFVKQYPYYDFLESEQGSANCQTLSRKFLKDKFGATKDKDGNDLPLNQATRM